MKALTVATRGTDLALAQTRLVISKLNKLYPELQINISKIATSGDKDMRTALWDLKSTGFFTSQVEQSLLEGKADIAVHSFKDLPTADQQGLTIAAVIERQFPQDCLVTNSPVNSIDELAESAIVGTSSLRRAAQLKHLRSDLQIEPIRGNVQTRIDKLIAGKFDAIILARAGLERLGLTEKISICFDPMHFIPAPAQGALAVQARSDDEQTINILAQIDDKQTRTAVSAERQILASTQCGCHAPVGAFAKILKSDIMIIAFVSDMQGEQLIRREIRGPVENADDLARELAERLLSNGGREILEKLEK